MTPPQSAIYFDDVCYIGWLNHAQGNARTILTAEQVAHISGVFEDVLDGKCQLVFSALHRMNVEELHGGDGGFFEKLRRWEHAYEHHPSHHDFTVAGELRERARKEHDGRATNKTAKLGESDGLHLACAMATKCESFLTFDAKLIRLYQEGIIPEIRIEEPHSDRLPFFFSDIASHGAAYGEEG